MNLDSIRRAIAARGLTPATAVPDSSGGRAGEASVRPAGLVEGSSLVARSVGQAQPWAGSLAYIDGIQQSAVVGYAGAAPIVVAEIAAAVRERQHRTLHTVLEGRRRLVLGRAA